MHIRTRMLFTSLGFGLIAVLLLSLACTNSDPTNPVVTADPPSLPPLSSMMIDFSDFTLPGASLEPGDPGLSTEELQSYGNWGWAVLNVAVWNTVIGVTLGVPVASFAEAFNYEPEEQPDGSWVWSYTFDVIQIRYMAELHGRLVREGFEWEMYISRKDGFDHFLWYSGLCDLFSEEGTWTFFKDPEEPVPFVEAEWHWDSNTDTGDLRFTNIEPGSPENGGYIAYEVNAPSVVEIPYDAFYNIYNKGNENHTDIEWNQTSLEGHIRDPLHYQDNAWHCWDSNLEDTECP